MRVVARQAPCPVRVFHDPDDEDTSFKESAEFVAEWRGARLVPCPGRGHFRILVTTEVVLASVNFFAEVCGGAGSK